MRQVHASSKEHDSMIVLTKGTAPTPPVITRDSGFSVGKTSVSELRNNRGLFNVSFHAEPWRSLLSAVSLLLNINQNFPLQGLQGTF